MSTNRLEETIQALLVPGKGILAADETVENTGKRFESMGTDSEDVEARAQLAGA